MKFETGNSKIQCNNATHYTSMSCTMLFVLGYFWHIISCTCDRHMTVKTMYCLTMTENYVGVSRQAEFRAIHNKLFLRTEYDIYKAVLDMGVSGPRMRHVIWIWIICYHEDKDCDDDMIKIMTVIMKTMRWQPWQKCNQSHTDGRTKHSSPWNLPVKRMEGQIRAEESAAPI